MNIKVIGPTWEVESEAVEGVPRASLVDQLQKMVMRGEPLFMKTAAGGDMIFLPGSLKDCRIEVVG